MLDLNAFRLNNYLQNRCLRCLVCIVLCPETFIHILQNAESISSYASLLYSKPIMAQNSVNDCILGLLLRNTDEKSIRDRFLCINVIC